MRSRQAAGWHTPPLTRRLCCAPCPPPQAKDPALAQESWDRFLPNFKKKNVQRKKPKKVGGSGAGGEGQCGVHPPVCMKVDKGDIACWPQQHSSTLQNTRHSCRPPVPPSPPHPSPPQVREKKDYTPFPPPQQPSKEDLMLESGEYFLSAEQKAARAAAAQAARQAARTEERQRQREAAFQAPAEGGRGGGAAQQGAAAAAQGQQTAASLAEGLKKKLKAVCKGGWVVLVPAAAAPSASGLSLKQPFGCRTAAAARAQVTGLLLRFKDVAAQ